MSVWDNIEKAMKSKGISAAELSRRTGISQGNISEWKKRKFEPSAAAIKKVADVLETSTAYLLGETDVSTPAYAVTLSGDMLPVDVNDPDIQKILQSLQDLDSKGLKIVSAFIEGYKAQKK